MKKYLILILIPIMLLATSETKTDVDMRLKTETRPNIIIKRVTNSSLPKSDPRLKIDSEKNSEVQTEAENQPKTQIQDRLETKAKIEHKTKICPSLKIALLLPYKKIGKYSSSTTNASFAYLVSKNRPFELKSYKIDSESFEDISRALKKIKEDDFCYVIAPLTQDGADVVAKINPEIAIYFPTINKKDSQSTSKYLYYGGIDYRAQSNILIKQAKSPLVIFYDESNIGKKISLYQEKKITESNKNATVLKFLIPEKTTSLDKQLSNNKNIHHGSFMVNTPIVKSGMVVSQLTLYNAEATNILSTQANYNPLLLSMTQPQDIKDMIIANSITQSRDVLIEANVLMDNDIVYDWINYTTTVGIDYFYNTIYAEDREYDIEVVNNQMIYPIELLQPSITNFKPFSSASK